jgi:hypothetical protein
VYRKGRNPLLPTERWCPTQAFLLAWGFCVPELKNPTQQKER